MEMLKEKNTDIERSIYVACLSSYNNGILHGKWIKLLTKKPYHDEEIWEFDKNYIQDEINSMLKSSKMPYADEWAVHDYNNFINLGEYPSIDEIEKYMYAIEKHSYDVVKGFKEMYPSEDISSLDDKEYHLHYSSFKEYAEHYANEIVLCEYNSDSTIYRYFDYDLFAKDLQDNYSVYETDDHDVVIFEDN
jgi:antirestriction protein